MNTALQTIVVWTPVWPLRDLEDVRGWSDRAGRTRHRLLVGKGGGLLAVRCWPDRAADFSAAGGRSSSPP